MTVLTVHDERDAHTHTHISQSHTCTRDDAPVSTALMLETVESEKWKEGPRGVVMVMVVEGGREGWWGVCCLHGNVPTVQKKKNHLVGKTFHSVQ